MKFLVLCMSIVLLSLYACRSNTQNTGESFERVSGSELKSLRDDQGYIVRAQKATNTTEESFFLEVCLKKQGSFETLESSCIPAFQNYDGKTTIIQNNNIKDALTKTTQDSTFDLHYGPILVLAALASPFVGAGICYSLYRIGTTGLMVPVVGVVVGVLAGLATIGCAGLLGLYFTSGIGLGILAYGLEDSANKETVKTPVPWRIPKALQTNLMSRALDDDPHEVKSILASLRGIGSYLKEHVSSAKHLHKLCLPDKADLGKALCQVL